MHSFRHHRAARPTALAAGFVGLLAFSLLVGVLPANAQTAENPAVLSASDIASLKVAIETPAPPVETEAATDAVTDIPGAPSAAVLEPLVTASVAVEDGVAIVGDSVAALPTPENNSLSLSNGASDVTVSLSIVGASTTEMSGDAAVTQSVDPGTSVISHVTPEGGIQLLSVTQTAVLQVKFGIDTTIPDGSYWEKQADGSLHLIDPTLPAAQNILMVAAAPWAIDANGTQLPTQYVVTAGTITQLVDSSTAVFPVVADPTLWWWASSIALCAIEVAPILTPAVAGKVALALAKASSIINKSARLSAAVQKLGGIKSALSSLYKFAASKGAGMSKGMIASVQLVWLAGMELIFNVLGIGDCGALLMQLI